MVDHRATVPLLSSWGTPCLHVCRHAMYAHAQRTRMPRMRTHGTQEYAREHGSTGAQALRSTSLPNKSLYIVAEPKDLHLYTDVHVSVHVNC